jgi:hypothetical protein
MFSSFSFINFMFSPQDTLVKAEPKESLKKIAISVALLELRVSHTLYNTAMVFHPIAPRVPLMDHPWVVEYLSTTLVSTLLEPVEPPNTKMSLLYATKVGMLLVANIVGPTLHVPRAMLYRSTKAELAPEPAMVQPPPHRA